MKNKIIKALAAGFLSAILIIPCGTVVKAAETTEIQSVQITETKRAFKFGSKLDDLKAQIAGLLNIDLGQIEKVIVKTKDDVKVILKDSNIDIDINLHLFEININQK